MTRLETRKTKLSFVTADSVRERGKSRPVVIEATTPYWATVRLAGMRKAYKVSFASIYTLAVKQEVEKQRAEKKAAKKGRVR
jgi:hypothetical protein